MINRDDIEAGDKCYTRDGGCLVAWKRDGDLLLGLDIVSLWEKNGAGAFEHLDIIRIEKAPKPVVEERWFAESEHMMVYGKEQLAGDNFKTIIKLTIINGKLEKSEQVK